MKIIQNFRLNLEIEMRMKIDWNKFASTNLPI